MTAENELRVLIVDDEEIVQQTLGEFLRALGHQVDGALDGAAAMEAMEACAYDLALVDVRMPGIDGLSLLARSREIYPELPIAMMAGHGDQEIVAKALGLGAIDFMTKPFQLSELDVVLKRIDPNPRSS